MPQTTTVTWRGDAILSMVRQAAMRGVARGTEAVLAEAVRSILHDPKTGRVYRKRATTKSGKPSKRKVYVQHQASAPGESPASDTGRLVGSGRTSYDRGQLLGTVYFSTDYARGLELGTERVAARPFLRPALSKNRAFITQAIGEEIAAALASGGRSR